MKENKILFFDIDGTLIDSTTHVIPQSTITALQQLRKDGHILCISTGRSLQSVMDSGLHEIINWDIYLCNNGQAIYDHEQKTLQLTPIPREAVYACLEKAKQLDSPLLIMGQTNRLSAEANENVLVSTEFFKESIPPVLPYDDSPVIMMIAYGPMGYDYNDYRDIDGLDIIPGQSSYADVVLKGYNKFIGIRYVLDYFHKQEYIAFGDSLNDMEMLEHASSGIAMGNAHEDLKAIADRITEDVSHDGIYIALQKLHLLG